MVDFPQREHGETECPEAEAADAGFLRGDGERIRERIAQVCVGDADELIDGGVEGGAIASGGQRFELEPGAAEDIAREPAHAASPVVPGVLEDVGHLEALAERRRE